MSDYIPEEIQVKILKHLPVKSLLRSRCVCKSWKELIDSHSFVQDHLAVQKPRFIVQYDSPELHVFDPLTLPDTSGGPLEHQQFGLIGALHGVVCLAHCLDGIRLWNPSTRKFLRISNPQDHLYEGNDEQTTTYTSFWIDPSTKDFKLFMVVFGNDDDCEGLFYSSDEQVWKRSDLPEIRYCKPLELQGCMALVMGGVAYWAAELQCDWEDRTAESIGVVVVWSFDFVHERFDIMEAPTPSTICEYMSYPMLCNWEDGLSLLYLETERCDIYLRQGGSWVNMFRVSLPSNITCVHWVVREMDQERCRILVEEQGRVLATISGELELCDTGAGCIPTKSGLEGRYTYATNNNYYFDFFVAYGFVESLLFPDS